MVFAVQVWVRLKICIQQSMSSHCDGNKFEKYRYLTKILIECFRKLVKGRRHLQALVQHTPLALDANILGPFHKPVKVTLGRKSSSNSKLLGPLLKQRVHSLHRSLLLSQYHHNSEHC